MKSRRALETSVTLLACGPWTWLAPPRADRRPLPFPPNMPMLWSEPCTVCCHCCCICYGEGACARAARGQAETVAQLPSFYAEDTPASANELWSRLHSDPLFAARPAARAALTLHARRRTGAGAWKSVPQYSEFGPPNCWR